MKLSGAVLIALTLAPLLGCASKPSVSNPIEVDVREYSRLERAAVLVLRDRGFRVDRQDYRFGVVTSKPQGASTIFEPWRADKNTLALATQSTFNNERRLVRITLQPVENDPATYLLSSEVVIERQARPGKRLTGSSNGYNVFGSTMPLSDDQARAGLAPIYWRPVQRDESLERDLLARIIRKSILLPEISPAPEPDPTAPPAVDTTDAPPTDEIDHMR
ncbi:MAG: hypothetical protein GC164_03265 [Phycisphaera sp.]|nr:hypothetical protein [Phycisphaera sp.]